MDEFGINIESLYFKWITSMVFPDESIRDRYSLVLSLLNHTDFEYILALDENRLIDGIDLRYNFSYDCKIPYNIIESLFDKNKCSMLEMMVSLARRCDNSIMYDNTYGDRTSQWFNTMFINLGLDRYPNDAWNVNSHYEVKEILKRCMYRQYNADGTDGGLFHVSNPIYDMRNIEIWNQMCLSMNEIIYSNTN